MSLFGFNMQLAAQPLLAATLSGNVINVLAERGIVSSEAGIGEAIEQLTLARDDSEYRLALIYPRQVSGDPMQAWVHTRSAKDGGPNYHNPPWREIELMDVIRFGIAIERDLDHDAKQSLQTYHTGTKASSPDEAVTQYLDMLISAMNMELRSRD